MHQFMPKQCKRAGLKTISKAEYDAKSGPQLSEHVKNLACTAAATAAGAATLPAGPVASLAAGAAVGGGCAAYVIEAD
jgi:hypothetical protein